MIRIGIVGCGRILNAHLHGFRQLLDKGIVTFAITALVARNEADAWSFHTRGQGPTPRQPVLPPESGDPLAAPHTYLSDIQPGVEVGVYTDYRRMIDDGKVDAVLDTTPVFLHHEVGSAVLDAGLHYLVQKPLAVSVQAGRALVEKAKAVGKTLGVFEQARYRPLVRAASWAFRSGLLGDPQIAVLGSVGGPWSPNRVVADTPWRHEKRKAGGGGSIDIGVHQMDILRHIFGEIDTVGAVVRTFEKERQSTTAKGETVRVQAEVDDTYFASVEFVNGAIAQMLWSWATRGEPLVLPGTPAFYGSRGCIRAGDIVYDAEHREDLWTKFERDAPSEVERLFPYGFHDPYAVLQFDWLRSMEANRDVETSGEEGLRDLAAAFAILESAESGTRVRVQDVLEGTVHREEI